MVQGRLPREPDRMVRAAAEHPATSQEQTVPDYENKTPPKRQEAF